jgi:hypothetical protein
MGLIYGPILTRCLCFQEALLEEEEEDDNGEEGL